MSKEEEQKRDREIEHRLSGLEQSLSELISNHVPHLESKIDRAQWLLVSTLVSVIIGLVLIFFKR